jgi:adenylylsulfate kinase-like enzyme
MVVWFIGISGAGKSTLGLKLKQYYDIYNINSFLLDGDIVREFFDNDLGYSRSDRVSNIKRIMLSAYVLEKNGVIPIVCNISPFEYLRCFARKKFDNYNEIYLQKNLEVARSNDVKSIYKEHLGKTPLIGVDLNFESPLNSDLVLETDKENVEISFRKILDYLRSK